MSRVQLALRVADLEASVAFYAKLFGAQPAKRRPGYANFAIAEPPLKLVLIEGTPGEPTRMDHLGVEVETTGRGHRRHRPPRRRRACPPLPRKTPPAATPSRTRSGSPAPASEPWEVYVVKGDANVLDKTPDSACCAPAAETDAAGQAAGAGCC